MINRVVTLASIPVAISMSLRDDRLSDNWQQQQLKKLKQFCQYAYSRTKFYHDLWSQAGVHPKDVECLEDYSQLPIVGRLDWRSLDNADIVPLGVTGPLWWRTTGGTTTGTAMRLPYTLGDELNMRGRMLSSLMRSGIGLTERIVRYQPPDMTLPTERAFWGKVFYVGSQASTEERLNALLSTPKVKSLISYGTPVWRVALMAYRRGIEIPGLKRLSVGGEVVTITQRRTIEKIFNSHVTHGYGASDFGRIATECEHGHLHINTDAVFVEVLDGASPAKPGKSGEVVVTNFVSHGRPVVRVRTGDRAVWGGEGGCECGLDTPYLQFVAGRMNDYIERLDGSKVLWHHLETVLEPVAETVLGYQLVQKNQRHIVCRLVLKERPESLAPYQALLDGLFPGQEITIETTDDIVSEPNGKTKPVIGMHSLK